MAFNKQAADFATVVDLAAEIRAAAGDIEALVGVILTRAKDLETARKSYERRAKNARNLTDRPHLTAKAQEAQESKKRCDFIVHTLMHKVRAPGLSDADWGLLARAFPQLKAR
jgi:hypothetical protein